MNIGTKGVIIEFEIVQQRHIRQHILDIHRFPPAGMGDDNIGNKAILAHLVENLRHWFAVANGVLKARGELDTLIEQFSKNWDITRMSCVDRNVMRIAVFELLYCEDIPPKVSINEAVDVGKKFGTEESGAFINGIMDSIRLELEKEGKLSNKDKLEAEGDLS